VLLAAAAWLVAVDGSARAAFPGINGRIAFQSDRDGNREIYSMNPEGSDPRRLTNDPALDSSPVYSPDGTKIAFVSDREDGYQIWVMNADGSNPARITDACGALTPAWSPDGTRIAFTEFCNDDVYVVDADGTDMVGLATTSDFERFPSWSPDGSTIAYNRFNGSDDDVWAMDADGANQVDLTNDPAVELHPDWSPDGTRIVYAKQVADGLDLFVMNADGSSPTNLTDSPEQESWPVWSPDANRIAFAVDEADVWTIGANGIGRVNLTASSSANDNIPDWQPYTGPIADLTLSSTDTPDPVTPGSEITYDVDVANLGPNAADDVQVSGAVPTGTTFVSLTSGSGWFCVTPVAGGTGSLSCDTPSMAAGTASQLVVVVEVSVDGADGSTIAQAMSVSSGTFDANPANNAGASTTAVAASPGPCTIVGTADADVLTGTPSNDVICAGDGNDVIDGGEGDDIIVGGLGKDVLTGGDGNDTLVGWGGRDELHGDAGLDVLIGGKGRDILDGLDEIGGDVLDGGSRADTCSMDEGDLTTACP
jgi:TolB protein